MSVRLYLISLFSLTLVVTAASATGQVSGQDVGRRVAAARIDHAPPLDGTLEDSIWKTAEPLIDFRQREPLETSPGTERTEVRILYDSHHVYFGIHCYDSDPASIVATQLRRDLSMDLDDNFAIMIDPTLSHRSGYIFEINPLGTQRDGQVIEGTAPN
jgi:hypothetical protein